MENQIYQPRVRVAPTASVDNGRKNKNPTIVFSILDKLIATSVFMMFLGLPLFFTGMTLQGIVFEKQIYFFFWVLVALIAWVGKGVMTGEIHVRKTPLDIPLGIFWMVYVLSTIISIDRWHSFFGLFGDPSRGLMNITAIIIMYYVIMSNFTWCLFRWVLLAIMVASGVVLAWTTLGVFGIKFLPDSISAYAPLSLVGSVSGLGMFIAVIFPLTIMSIFKLQENKELRGVLRTVGTGMLLVGLLLEILLLLVLYGFIPWIGLMIGFGVFLIFILAQLVRPNEKWIWVSVATFILIMVIWMSGADFKLAKIELPVEVGPSYALSFQIAKESLKNDFVLGSGVASYGYSFSLYKPEAFNLNQLYNLRFYQATGVVFEVISSMGILGFLALFLLLLSFVSVCIYLLIIKKEKNKVYSLGLVSASLIFLISALLVRTEGTVLIFGSLILALTLAMVIRESESEESFVNISLKASPKYALTLAFIFIVVSIGVAYLFVFLGKAYVADIFAGKAILKSNESREDSIQLMARGIDFNSREGKYYINIGQNYMFLANQEMMKDEGNRNMKAVQEYLNQSIVATESGRQLMTNDVSAVEAVAQIYENAGVYVADSLKKSEEAYNRALELEPNNPNFMLGLGKSKLSQSVTLKGEDEKKQKINEAKDLFQKAIDKKNNFAPGYYQLSITQGALGDLDAAIESMNKAVMLEKNINNFFNLGRLYQQRATGEDEKIAESIFQKIIEVKDDEVNTHFSLATLYEKMGEKDKALAEYTKVQSLVPAENSEVSEKVAEMIENLKNGKSNLEKEKSTAEIESQEQVLPVESSQVPTEQVQ